MFAAQDDRAGLELQDLQGAAAVAKTPTVFAKPDCLVVSHQAKSSNASLKFEQPARVLSWLTIISIQLVKSMLL